MTGPNTLTNDLIDSWADDSRGPVALHLRQRLIPVEGEQGVIFPPTYADIGYNIDTLSDGTRVAMIDSVGSQANRLEPLFKKDKYSKLVPQIEIELYSKKSEKQEDGEYTKKVSLLDLAHRSADAVVHSSPELAVHIAEAFAALSQRGDAGPLCRIAPTSLVFGVWDSRGNSAEKRPRLVRSIIRAWDVEPLHTAAQFNSVWKSLEDEQKGALKDKVEELKKKKQNVKLSEKGFADAPAIFRKVGTTARKHMHEYRDGSPNPERRVLGGVVSRGEIIREVTVNLVALRALQGADAQETKNIRRYLLALSLLAASAELDLYLREGCHLRFADDRDIWNSVPRRGEPTPLEISSDAAQAILLDYAKTAVEPFKNGWPEQLSYKFDLKEAKNLLAKKEEAENAPE
ncbi:MAG: type I-U CRISPR-associated protein Cas7 [Candidatus Thiosymbion ectosymbiont of Robbea hypermnestra]|nr:type I-U CRISPR-associated protein Cas7 [Candidatus Thiosymbion ectosymbiont of Robbea hypermnestra]